MVEINGDLRILQEKLWDAIMLDGKDISTVEIPVKITVLRKLFQQIEGFKRQVEK